MKRKTNQTRLTGTSGIDTDGFWFINSPNFKLVIFGLLWKPSFFSFRFLFSIYSEFLKYHGGNHLSFCCFSGCSDLWIIAKSDLDYVTACDVNPKIFKTHTHKDLKVIKNFEHFQIFKTMTFSCQHSYFT